MSLLLHDILLEMIEEDLKVFRFHLLNLKLKDYKPIPRSYLAECTAHNFVSKMTEAYLESGALEVTKHILTKMNQKDLVQKLEEENGTGQEDPECEAVSNNKPETSTSKKSVQKKPPVKKPPIQQAFEDSISENSNSKDGKKMHQNDLVQKLGEENKTGEGVPYNQEDLECEAVSNDKPETSTSKKSVQNPVKKKPAFEGSISNVSKFLDGQKGKYFTANLNTTKGCLLVLVLDLNEHKRFKGAEKRKSGVKLTKVSLEKLGINKQKLGLRFTQKSKFSFTRKQATEVDADKQDK